MMTSLPERLQQLKKFYGISKKRIVEKLDISDRNYRRYETGEIDPPVSKIIALADYFCVSLDYIVGRTDIPCSKEYIFELEKIFLNIVK